MDTQRDAFKTIDLKSTNLKHKNAGYMAVK